MSSPSRKKTDPRPVRQDRQSMPSDHETASPESGDRAMPTDTGTVPQRESGPAGQPEVERPADHEYASPESGDRAMPTNAGAKAGSQQKQSPSSEL